jgi:hypothetical protein
VFEGDDASLELGDGREDPLEVPKDLLVGDGLIGELPVVRVSLLGPDDGLVAHLAENLADAVVDVSVWGAPVLCLEFCHVKDHILGPLDLGDNLLVRERRHTGMGPGFLL